ncbi:MAG: lysophospholipid acyltransferase family protein [Candidatus Aminicenantes bacterium]|nr:lysophospholipid acyltransferase family protein [Candidatus Aminicenantes bacterium]
MTFKERLRGLIIDALGKPILWLWTKSCRLTIVGESEYRALRDTGRPVVHLIWHGKIFIVPYFFRKRNIMPLVSPSRDGEIAARIMDGWGYKLLRGSGTHFMKNAWLDMKKELQGGGEVIIVPDGPRGPDRKLKMGGIKLAAETGAALVPFSFSTSKKKILHSWDRFLIFTPFSRIVAVYGRPIEIPQGLNAEGMESERRRVERLMIDFDEETDRFFDKEN